MFKVYRRPTDEPGPAHAGSAIVCYLLLSAVFPFMTSMAIGEWTSRGSEDWISRLELTLFISYFIAIPPFIGWFATRADLDNLLVLVRQPDHVLGLSAMPGDGGSGSIGMAHDRRAR